MRHPHVSRRMVLGLASAVAILIVARPVLQAGPPPGVVASAATGGAFGGPNEAASPEPPKVYLSAPPMTAEAAKTYAKLQEKVAINFTADTSLEEVKKYIERVTASKDDPDSGVPIYFSPVGLQSADMTMQSTVNLSFRKPIPLATSLRLMLDQVNLRYAIQEDGIIYITHREDDKIPSDPGPMILSSLAETRAEVMALREEVRLFRRGEPPTATAASDRMANTPGPPLVSPRAGNPGGMR